MPLRGNLISSPDDPGIFRRAVLFQFFEELFEARVELPNRAVAVETQRQIARRRHGLVYSERWGERNKQRVTDVTEGNAPTISPEILLRHRGHASGNRVVKGYSQPRIEVGLIKVGLCFASGLLMPSKYPFAR